MNFGYRKCLQSYKLDQSFYYVMLSFLVNVQCLHWGWIFATNITGKFHSMLKIIKESSLLSINVVLIRSNTESWTPNLGIFSEHFSCYGFFSTISVEVSNWYQNKEKHFVDSELKIRDLIWWVYYLKITTTIQNGHEVLCKLVICI